MIKKYDWARKICIYNLSLSGSHETQRDICDYSNILEGKLLDKRHFIKLGPSTKRSTKNESNQRLSIENGHSTFKTMVSLFPVCVIDIHSFA